MKYKLLFFLPIVIHCTSCNVTKYAKHEKQLASKSASKTRIESEIESKLFFDIEKERLLGTSKKSGLDAYNNFVLKYPLNSTARYNLARIQFNKNELANALKNSEQALNLNPNNRIFREFYMQMLLYNDKLSLAEEQVNLLLAERPDDEDYLFKKAMIHLQNDDFEKAIKSFEELENVIGFNEELILQKKNILFRNGKLKEAEREIKKLQQAFPESPKYTLMWIDMAEQNNQKNIEDSLYHSLETNYPNDPMAQVSLAQHYLQLKDNVKYNAFMKKVMQNKNLDATSKLSLILPALKAFNEESILQRKEIIDMTKSIVEEAPQNTEALALYADVLYFSNDISNAKKAYENLINKDSSKIESWIQLIGIYFDNKEYSNVLETSNRCLAIFPKSNMAKFYQGITLIQLNETQKGIDALEIAIENTKYNTELLAQMHSSLGDAYHTLNKHTMSDSVFNLALKYAPGDAGVLNNYAYYLSIRNERLEEAAKMSKYSLEIQPDSKSFLDTYGWIQFQQGKYDEAKTYIEKAINIDGENDATLFEHLGDVYFKLSNSLKAIEYWKKAHELDIKNETLLYKILHGKIPE